VIQIFSNPLEQELNEIVQSAFERSCGIGSADLKNFEEFLGVLKTESQKYTQFDILVFINPGEEISVSLINILKTLTAKVIVLGKLPPSLAKFLEVSVIPVTEQIVLAAACEPAKTYRYSESLGSIVYQKALELEVGKQIRLPSRSLCRFDFSNEWNNLGFGAITVDDSIWAISQKAIIPEQNVISKLVVANEGLSAYCGLWDFQRASLLWFNRAVGPVDSYEWYLLEQYIAQYRFSDLPAWPVISEIPYGFDSAVTMRLDCDEDIESARALGNAYQENKIPFSLALHATVLANRDQHQYPRDVIKAGGAVLSHTLTHAPNWGGSEDAAKHEGEESAKIIQETIGVRPRYAVSPFHHTPAYARSGLANAGYEGIVGGIISNDPDFVMARAGRPPKAKKGLIGHTQQCMLHGDCLLEEGDPLSIYKRAYEQAKVSKTFFGYLDHPFSPRYQYGWATEAERIEAHIEFINYIQQSSKNIAFLNQDDALDFLSMKSQVRVRELDGQLHITSPQKMNHRFNIAFQYGNDQYELTADEVTL
jgi:peptidoglycan/xylan/chitin deacetylase (PgdA/CDA1 family)